MHKRKIFVFIVLFSLVKTYGQTDSTFVDNKYLEDQFYFSLNYNLLVNQPSNFNQNGISGGVTLGYIRDFPLNNRRNVALGVGLGYAYNAYNQNLKISENGLYEIISNDDFNSNRLTTYAVELPIEFRWRTSNATTYSFWRIYTGVKLGYVFANKSKYTDDIEIIKVKNIDEFQNFQYGLTFSAGYSSFNLSLYYGLNSLFKDAYVEGNIVKLKQFNIGLMFYIL
ncbi:MAG: porin family protein [Urechidicola sp.]|nr:porin family protein [Urechidicola sp.]